MRTSILSSVLLALLGLHVCIPVESKLCDDPRKIKTVQFVDLTSLTLDMYYCDSSIPKKILSNCYAFLQPEEGKDGLSKGEHNFFDIKTEKPVTMNFTMKREDEIGVYSFTSGDAKATAYLTDVTEDGKCLTYFKCFSGGSWGGEDTEGEYAAIVCTNPDLCGTAPYLKLVDKVEKNLLSDGAKLDKIDQTKCESLGIIPK